MESRNRRAWGAPAYPMAWGIAAALLLAPCFVDAATSGAAEPTGAAEPKRVSGRATKPDSTMTLRAGQEGTEFRTLTVEGEDRVHVDIERPPLAIALDPETVPGLDQGTARDVLDRTIPDLFTPMVALSSQEHSPYRARPWLRQFASGAVARFRPQIRDSERWKLMIANSRGETVASYEGRGEPPKEIAWDGRSKSGAPVLPGLTYSYVLEAYDRAGNKRNFVGEGFQVSAYRIDDPAAPRLVFSGKDLAWDASGRGGYAGVGAGRAAGRSSARPGAGADASAGYAPPLLLEAASWMNQTLKPRDPVRVRAVARTRDYAQALASRTAAVLASRTLGDPARIQVVAEVEADAPADGTVQIGPAK